MDEYFLDYLICQYEIHRLVKQGENEIKITASQFDVELELEPVILKGSFGVYHRDDVWMMDAPVKLEQGSILKQGYPFYHGSVIYEGIYTAQAGKACLLHVPDSEAAAVSVTVNHKYAGLININGRKGMDITPYLEAGENLIQVKLCVSMKNLLGPHFDPDKPRRTAWPDMWKKAPAFGIPKPEEYDLISYGLEKGIVLTE